MDSMRALSSAEIQSHLSALFDPHSESSSFEEALEKYIQVASPLSQNSTATPGGAKGAGLQSNGIEEMLSALNNSVASHSGSSHGSGHSHSEGSNANSPASFGRPASALASHVPSGPPAQQQSLEGALAALGESGRQQLLAILQLANAAPSSTTPNAASASTQQQHHHFPNTGDRNLPAKASHQNLAALTMPEGMKQGSSSTGSSRSSNGRQSNPPSSINPYLPGYAQNPETSPVYYANAFTQYVSPTNGNSSSSQTYSRPGSVQASPALGPTSGGQFPYEQDQGQQQSHSSAFSRTASVNEVQYGSMDGQDYRSPRMAPGTSSSAFYSENGNGDESDLLFTPLLSPALTASTQPGPSVGPIADSFAHLGSISLSSSPNKGGSSRHSLSHQQYVQQQQAQGFQNGVSPMHVFSPLTSPAMGPQGQHSQQQQHFRTSQSSNGSNGPASQASSQSRSLPSLSKRNSPTDANEEFASPAQTPSHPTSSANTATSATTKSSRPPGIRGASKNNAKTRPSPIIRPTDNGMHAKEREKKHSSKRQSMGGQASLPSSSTTSTPAFGPVQSAQNAYALAQNALQNSPSPHHFDLSSSHQPSSSNTSPSFMGNNDFQQQQQTYHYNPSTAHHSRSSSTAQNAAHGANSTPTNIPSPLDLNSIFNLINSSGATSQQDVTSPTTQGQTYHVNQTPRSAQDEFLHSLTSSSGFANTGQTNAGASSEMQIDVQDSQGAGPSGTAHVDSNMLAAFAAYQAAASAAALINSQAAPQQNSAGLANTQLQQLQTASMATAFGQQASHQAGQFALTPASFMGLPANQYHLLSGLSADQPHPSPILHQLHPTNDSSSSGTALQSPQGGTTNDFGGSLGEAALAFESQNHNAATAPASSAVRPKGSSRESRPGSANTSPNLLAQNIREAAAAALAEKEAKSASKGRGRKAKAAEDQTSESSGKQKAQNKAQGQGQAVEEDEDDETETKKQEKKLTRKPSKRTAAAKAAKEVDSAMNDNARSFLNGASDHSLETSPMLSATTSNISGETRKSSHKVAEQRRRDSLKLCFEELRFILPPINPDEDEDFAGDRKRPGENNVGGQRGKSHSIDPKHPNKGISKVALLRKSNEYVTKLHERVDRRDTAIELLRAELRACRAALGEAGLPVMDSEALDRLSSVDWDELASDVDPVPPTYRLHALSPAMQNLGSKLFKPSQPSIIEEQDKASGMHEDQEQDAEADGVDEDEEDDDADYKGTSAAKMIRRSNTSAATTRLSKAQTSKR